MKKFAIARCRCISDRSYYPSELTEEYERDLTLLEKALEFLPSFWPSSQDIRIKQCLLTIVGVAIHAAPTEVVLMFYAEPPHSFLNTSISCETIHGAETPLELTLLIKERLRRILFQQ